MPERRCCATCFDDRHIRAQLIDRCEPVRQDCDYCGAADALCVIPSRLSQWFAPLIATYSENPDGDFLVRHLISEWRMFSNGNLSEAGAKELLADVLDDGEIVRKKFTPIAHPSGGNLRRWEELRDELMHSNRWFLKEPMDMDRLAVLLDQLITTPTALEFSNWYRARLMTGDDAFPLKDMGAPPSDKAGHGRANPAGIPYLYLGSTRATAVAELRPHTGERACVARFGLSDADNLKLADLRDPRSLISPLSDGDETLIIELRADLPLLERLGEELTRPVQPSGAAYEYVPTQYLCEYIKKKGFDGVLYRSSVSSDDGVNIALFHPTVATATQPDVVSVTKVTVSIGN